MTLSPWAVDVRLPVVTVVVLLDALIDCPVCSVMVHDVDPSRLMIIVEPTGATAGRAKERAAPPVQKYPLLTTNVWLADIADQERRLVADVNTGGLPAPCDSKTWPALPTVVVTILVPS
jgi:hypothetical protein